MQFFECLVGGQVLGGGGEDGGGEACGVVGVREGHGAGVHEVHHLVLGLADVGPGGGVEVDLLREVVLPLVTDVLGHHALQQLEVHARLVAAQHQAVGRDALQEQRHAFVGLQADGRHHLEGLAALVNLHLQQAFFLLVVEIAFHQQVENDTRQGKGGQHGQDQNSS